MLLTLECAKPVSYLLPFNWQRWCKFEDVLKSVARAVKSVIELTEHSYRPLPAQLISDFAALVGPSRIPERLLVQTEREEDYVFRYSLDGHRLLGVVVPHTGTQQDPPYTPLYLNPPVTPETYVSEEWVNDVLNAILQGAAAVADWRGNLVGFPPGEKQDRNKVIQLGKRKEAGSS